MILNEHAKWVNIFSKIICLQRICFQVLILAAASDQEIVICADFYTCCISNYRVFMFTASSAPEKTIYVDAPIPTA